MKPLGVALVGPGRAGRARLAALGAHPGAQLRAVVAREGAPQLRDVLADPRVQALLVCTPNHLHAPTVRAALHAGRHVCVEYPLAPGASQARELFALARERGLVLHVEHIELLSPAQEAQRRRARELGRPRGGSLHFRGDFSGWIADPARAGSPALLALARLQRLLDLFGPARVASAQLERPQGGGYRLQLALQFAQGGATELCEERAPGLPRELHWNVACEHGALDTPDTPAARGLFARDLDHFLTRVVHGGKPYVSEERIAHALELVEHIERVLALASC